MVTRVLGLTLGLQLGYGTLTLTLMTTDEGSTFWESLNLSGFKYGTEHKFSERRRGSAAHYSMSCQLPTSKSDQFDIRVTLGDNGKNMQGLLKRLEAYWDQGTVRYYHVSGIEIGDNPLIADVFGKQHVHVALVLFNKTTNRSVFNKLKLGSYGGYYCSVRDKSKTISGWLAYHKKMRTKMPGQPALQIQKGDLPTDRRVYTAEQRVAAESAKVKETQAKWARRKALIIAGDFDTLDDEFPGFQYTTQGRCMKNDLLKQRNDQHCQQLEGKLCNYIIFGASGTGKSASIAHLFPRCYKKQKGTQFWDGYDRENVDHKVVWIDEMSKETLKCISGKQDGGFEFLKELGDRYPVTVDAKYMPAQKIRPSQVMITMNEHPTTLLPDRAQEVNKVALFRKFNILHVNDWLLMNGLRCVDGVGVEPILNTDLDNMDATRIIDTTDVSRQIVFDTDSGSETELDSDFETESLSPEILPFTNYTPTQQDGPNDKDRCPPRPSKRDSRPQSEGPEAIRALLQAKRRSRLRDINEAKRRRL